MTRGRNTEKRSMTLGERTDIQGLKKETEANLRFLEENPGVSRGDSVSKDRMKKEIKRYDQILHEGAPVAPRGSNKDALVKEARQLEEQMRVNMPTREQMDHPAKNPGAIHKHLKWSKENDPRVRRYKEIQRRLEPEDPTAMDVEKLRRDK